MRDINSVMPQTTHVQASDVSKVLRNTYFLLALTLAFSAMTAGISMALNVPHPGIIITLIMFYGLLFAIAKTRNSIWGLVLTFALTGFMGLTLGPILNAYLSIPGGSQLVMNALGLTAVTFFGLSGYALVTRKDFSFLNGFLVAGFFVLMGAVVLNLFMQIPALQLVISAGFVLFASAAILWQTGAIIHGGERNYVMAAVTLYVQIYNLFLSILNLLTAFGGDD